MDGQTQKHVTQTYIQERECGSRATPPVSCYCCCCRCIKILWNSFEKTTVTVGNHEENRAIKITETVSSPTERCVMRRKYRIATVDLFLNPRGGYCNCRCHLTHPATQSDTSSDTMGPSHSSTTVVFRTADTAVTSITAAATVDWRGRHCTHLFWFIVFNQPPPPDQCAYCDNGTRYLRRELFLQRAVVVVVVT